jgi:hypothetical protein
MATSYGSLKYSNTRFDGLYGSSLETGESALKEELTKAETFEASWSKVRARAEKKITLNAAEILGVNCSEKRADTLRGAIIAYQDILSLGNNE